MHNACITVSSAILSQLLYGTVCLVNVWNASLFKESS